MIYNITITYRLHKYIGTIILFYEKIAKNLLLYN